MCVGVEGVQALNDFFSIAFGNGKEKCICRC